MSYVTRGFDDKVVELLQHGGVGLLPADTIYGLSCRALDKRAVKRLRKIKLRDKGKPFIVLFSSLDQLNDLGVNSTEAALALRYWPGKLTIICQAKNTPQWLHMGTSTLAIRQPESQALRNLIDKIGPIVSTSANVQGDKPPATLSQAKEYFSDKLDFYVDAGRLSGRPSTIVQPVFRKLKIIRQGAVKVSKEDRL